VPLPAPRRRKPAQNAMPMGAAAGGGTPTMRAIESFSTALRIVKASRASVAYRVLRQLALQGTPVHVQGAGGGRDVAIVCQEHLLQMLPFEPFY